MRALIVHESYFGNTRQLAEAMAAALQHSGHDATAVQADRATEELVRDADLLIVGAPTHAHSLPSARTRASTQQQGVAAAVATAPGVRELLDRLPAVPGLPAAAFDTRARMPRWLAGAASRPLAKRLGRLGYRMAVPRRASSSGARAGHSTPGRWSVPRIGRSASPRWRPCASVTQRRDGWGRVAVEAARPVGAQAVVCR